MIDEIITRAVIFKPKRLKDSWVHKRGFLVDIDASTAFNIIESEKNRRYRDGVSKKNLALGADGNKLKELAAKRLYEIQSSQNNYAEITFIIAGLFSGVNILQITPLVWGGSSLLLVKSLIVSAVVLCCSTLLYLHKKKLDKATVVSFIEIEDALYFKEYGKSQY